MNIACINVVTLKSFYWPQYHAIVIICGRVVECSSEHLSDIILTHTDVGKTILWLVLRCGSHMNGFIITITEGLKYLNITAASED